jgi:hypothetical protein
MICSAASVRDVIASADSLAWSAAEPASARRRRKPRPSIRDAIAAQGVGRRCFGLAWSPAA